MWTPFFMRKQCAHTDIFSGTINLRGFFMNSYKFIFFLLLMVALPTCHSQITNISRYFPLNEGDIYQYHGKYNNKEDTNSFLVNSIFLPNKQKLHYFQRGTTKRDDDFFGPNMFGNGLYFVFESKIFTLEAAFINEVDNLDFNNKQKLLPESLLSGSKVTIDSNYNNSKDTIEILGFENINVPFGKFNESLKLKITTSWSNGDIHESFVWLAKGIGVIKWIRATGRIDELVNYIPK